MIRSFWLTLSTALALTLAGCAGRTSRSPQLEVWDDMDRQPKVKAQSPSRFYGDGQANRYPVPGTIARPRRDWSRDADEGTGKDAVSQQVEQRDVFYTGLESPGRYVGKNPVPVTMDLLKTGQARFNTYCSPCHSRVGDGQGIVTVRAGWIATNLHEDRIKNTADGDIFDTITHGRRSMPSYRFQITEHDRWAVVAYVRALQRSQGTGYEDVPLDQRPSLRAPQKQAMLGGQISR